MKNIITWATWHCCDLSFISNEFRGFQQIAVCFSKFPNLKIDTVSKLLKACQHQILL